MLAAFLLLFFIVALGILFDMVGVAVTAADEKPFHAMAAKKVPGAGKAIWLLRNADKVASFCNDVVGDSFGRHRGADHRRDRPDGAGERRAAGDVRPGGGDDRRRQGGGEVHRHAVQHKHRLSDGARAGAVLPEKEINAACAADDRFIRKSLCRY